MLETILGVSWIYLMYRVGAVQSRMRDVLRRACEDADAELPLQSDTAQPAAA